MPTKSHEEALREAYEKGFQDAKSMYENLELFAWYNPTYDKFSKDLNSPLFSPLNQVWPLYRKIATPQKQD